MESVDFKAIQKIFAFAEPNDRQLPRRSDVELFFKIKRNELRNLNLA